MNNICTSGIYDYYLKFNIDRVSLQPETYGATIILECQLLYALCQARLCS